MNHSVTDIFDELCKAEISVRSRSTRKTFSLLDLLDENELDIQFNGCDSVGNYRNLIMKEYTRFKSDLSILATDSLDLITEYIHLISYRVKETSVLLNPKDQNLVFSHVVLPKNPRFVSNEYQAKIVKMKVLAYLGVQRETLRLIKGYLKVFSKAYAPDTISRHGKRKIPGQHSLFDPPLSNTLPWKAESTKLVELVAALSEAKVFGEDVTRKELWSYFSSAFDVPMEHAEKSLSQMKYRKNQQARFLEDIKDRFVNLMEKGMD